MKIVWTDAGPVSGAWDTLRAGGYEIGQLGQGDISGGGRIIRKFPILMSDSDGFVEEAFGFLFDVGYIRGSTRSARTLETYAESLLSWLTYAEREGLQWRRPTAPMLAAYRDHLLGTQGLARRARPLSRRTVNLRLTVAIEFYKHLGWIPDPWRPRSVSFRFSQHMIAPSSHPVIERGHGFERLRLRIYSRRPLALRAEHCRALCFELRNPYRLMWQWGLCTGLRTISLLQIKLRAFQSGGDCASDTQILDIVAKGGKIVTVHVPRELRRATEHYVAVDRVMAAALVRPKSSDPSLFLNLRGRPVTSKSYYRGEPS